jgi:hypothetical protein
MSRVTTKSESKIQRTKSTCSTQSHGKYALLSKGQGKPNLNAKKDTIQPLKNGIQAQEFIESITDEWFQ